MFESRQHREWIRGTVAGNEGSKRIRGRRAASSESGRRGGTGRAGAVIEGMPPRCRESTRKTAGQGGARQKHDAKMTVAGIAAVQRGMAERPGSTPTPATIDMPVPAIVGNEDEATPRSEAKIIARGTWSRSAVVPGDGITPLERSEEIHRLVREFCRDPVRRSEVRHDLQSKLTDGAGCQSDSHREIGLRPPRSRMKPRCARQTKYRK